MHNSFLTPSDQELLEQSMRDQSVRHEEVRHEEVRNEVRHEEVRHEEVRNEVRHEEVRHEEVRNEQIKAGRILLIEVTKTEDQGLLNTICEVREEMEHSCLPPIDACAWAVNRLKRLGLNEEQIRRIMGMQLRTMGKKVKTASRNLVQVRRMVKQPKLQYHQKRI